MESYYLLRNGIETGPYGFRKLLEMGLAVTDSFRRNGEEWSRVSDLDALRAKIMANSVVTERGVLLPADNVETKPSVPPRIKNRERTSNSSRGYDAASTIRVVVTDDHWIFRHGMIKSLAPYRDVKVVGEAEHGQQLINMLGHMAVDVILLDIQMPIMDGFAALQQIKRSHPQIKVIIISMHEGQSMVRRMLEAGADGYLGKMADAKQVHEAVVECHEKGRYMNRFAYDALLGTIRHVEENTQPKIERTIPFQPPIPPMTQEPERKNQDPLFDGKGSGFDGGRILEQLTANRNHRKRRPAQMPKVSLPVLLFTVGVVITIIIMIIVFWFRK